MTRNDVAPLPGMIGEHPAMREVYALVRRAAPTELPIAVVGETGTGKELVARAVHQLSSHREGPFVDINCAAIPEHLVESELFGWERGAFSGAVRSVPGLLEQADGGTLFLDEACSLPPAVQAKLLRALEQREHRRVGGRCTIRARSRLVLAVQRPLGELLRSGAWLPAFAHRVSGVTVSLPRLADRGRDIRLLAASFLIEAAAATGRTIIWSDEALQLLERLPWPGNVRELRALITRIPVSVDGEVVRAAHVRASHAWAAHTYVPESEIESALRECGSLADAARALGLPRSTLRDRVRKAAERGVRQAADANRHPVRAHTVPISRTQSALEGDDLRHG